MPEHVLAEVETGRLKTQIVVVGGGAGGLKLAKKLGHRLGRERFDVILIDRNQTHVWKPLLHEVAAGSLDANLDEVGYRGHAHKWGYRYFYGTMEAVDRDKREVVVAPILDDNGDELISRHRIRYDYLVLAVGSVSNDFGTPGVKDNCLFLESRQHADKFRLKLLNHCLRVSRSQNASATVKIAIVGAGATGVELAAELYGAAEALKHYGLEVFDESRLKVTLVEAGPRILPALPEKLAAAAHKELESLGVDIRINSSVTEATKAELVMKDGARIDADLIVWAAGVKAPPSLDGLDLPKNRLGQLIVGPTLQSVGDPLVFAIGDCCSYTPAGETRPVPPRAQAAQQMASIAYANIIASIEHGTQKTFQYKDRGSLISISHFFSVGTLMGNLVGPGMHIEGRLARLAYVSLYHLHLLGIHGWFRGMSMILAGQANRVLRPKFKLH